MLFRTCTPAALLALLLAPAAGLAQPAEPPADQAPAEPGCSSSKCHRGIEPIRDPKSAMGKELLERSQAAGDPDGCVICHGGDPAANTREAGHRGAPAALTQKGGPNAFYPDPGSPWVNSRTCARCHPRQAFGQWNCLMMTEAGKIQGVAWAFGGLTGYQHKWGNYDAKNPASPDERLGTDAYRAQMQRLSKLEPGVYPDKMSTLPAAPADPALLVKDPTLAAFTYIRSECERCHLAVRGRQARGDYRGMGCSACHIPYSNEGRYEGADRAIPRDKPGHVLVHTIQGTREARVRVNGKAYSGIPVETCTTCHDRGKRIGVSFQGLMESAFHSPYTKKGQGQPALHTKHYLALSEDQHYVKGMMCLDCHTSIDVHGDGFLFGANLSQVQIECADCHGTPDHYPWEMPLGRGEEHGGKLLQDKPRGLTTTLPRRLHQGTIYPPEGGYLLTARGNPFGNVMRRGDQVVVHTAGGKDILLDPLKRKAREQKLEREARVAMVGVKGHLKKMECYACHGTWAPQCYGCHAKIDYSGGRRSFDWVAAGHSHKKDPTRRGEAGLDTWMPGKVHEERSYMRWERPMLVVNGEGRVSPGAPGCQVSVTIVGAQGQTILQNHVFRTPPNTEGAGEAGQLSLDVSPTQPHTTGKARGCETCHSDPKAMGHGIAGGRLNRPWDKDLVVDLMSADRKILSRSARVQLAAIKGLSGDWSRIVDEQGRQQMTVGHHFSGSRPLDDQQRARMSRRGVCLSCHQEIPEASLAVSLLHHVAAATDQLPHTSAQHDDLLHKLLLLSGWVQVGGMAGLPLALLAGVLWWRRRRRRRRGTERAP